MQNVFFSLLNEATVRVLQKNSWEVTVPAEQECCGALQVHAGFRPIGHEQAMKNIAALEAGRYDAIITNTAGCGSVLKEHPDLFEHDPVWLDRARAFAGKMRDMSEVLASINSTRISAASNARSHTKICATCCTVRKSASRRAKRSRQSPGSSYTSSR